MIKEEILNKIKNWAVQHTKASDIHGLPHWERVANYGQILCDLAEQNGKRPNRDIVLLFAYLHDSCRENDFMDYEHGPKAAQTILTIRLTHLADLSDEEFALLQKAIDQHTVSRGTEDPTLNICFDSDRLDLDRVGIMPEISKLTSLEGKQYLFEYLDEYTEKFCN